MSGVVKLNDAFMGSFDMSRLQLLIVLVFALVWTACQHRACFGQSQFTTSDRNLKFAVPAGWKSEEAGSTIHINGPDGSKFILVRDNLKASGADASTDTSLRSGSEL